MSKLSEQGKCSNNWANNDFLNKKGAGFSAPIFILSAVFDDVKKNYSWY